MIPGREMADLTPEERARTVQVDCGTECPCDGPKVGLSVGKLDYVGQPFPDATHMILDKATNEWVVYVYDPGRTLRIREAARYPVAEVEAIRYLPNETRLYGHTFLPAADVEP
jgi:hypothetical protein